MRYKLIIALFTISTIAFFVQSTVYAQPYGKGIYDSNTHYGGETALSISGTNAINFSINPSTAGTLSSASGNVTVTSTDVVGYKLYIRALGSTSMTRVGSTIPASANLTLVPLVVNTWGYNTDASTNFIGITTLDVLLKNAVGPFSAGDSTTVTYGLNIDRAVPAGSYASNLVYTAVPQTN